MIEANLERVESLRVMRSDGNLKIIGTHAAEIKIHSNHAPETRRHDGAVEMLLEGGGEIEVPSGVTVEVLDCAGNLDLEDFSAPVTLGRVRGNLKVRNSGAVAVRGQINGN